jgi:hypothetical protein
MTTKNQTVEKDSVHVVVSTAEETAGTQQTLPSNGAAPAAVQAPAPAVMKAEKLSVIGRIAAIGDTELKVKHLAYAVGGTLVVCTGLQITHRWVPGCPAPFGHLFERKPALALLPAKKA